MKILMLSWEYPPQVVGGLGKHVVELVPELIAGDAEIHLVVPRLSGGEPEEPLLLPDGSPARNGSTIYRVEPSNAAGDIFTNTWHDNILIQEACSRLVRHDGKFDLVHCHDWLPGMAAVGLKHAFHLPLLATIHATEMGRNQGHLYTDMQRSIHMAEWWLAYEAWRLIACSEYMAWELTTYFGAARDKIDVIPNGVDPTPFDALEGKDFSEFRASVAAPGEAIVYSIGRLVYEKGLTVLIDAVPLILREYPNAKFVIAGGGAYVHDLRAKADALGVGSHIIFPGRISDEARDALFKVADVAVFPSLYEPFGIVALEAMAAGTPVVVSDAGGLSEVVKLHETGIKVHPNNPESLAWGILHTLKHPEWARMRAEKAAGMVRAEFDWSLIAERTLDVYRRIGAEAKAGEWAYRY